MLHEDQRWDPGAGSSSKTRPNKYSERLHVLTGTTAVSGTIHSG